MNSLLAADGYWNSVPFQKALTCSPTSYCRLLVIWSCFRFAKWPRREGDTVGVVAVTIAWAIDVEAHHVGRIVRGIGGDIDLLAGGAVHKSVDADGPGEIAITYSTPRPRHSQTTTSAIGNENMQFIK